MGLCCAKCRSQSDKRRYLRTRYNVEREMSVEFDNLMDDDPHDMSSAQYGAVMTDEERKYISERKFNDLVRHQKVVDAEIEAQLLEQEEQLRVEEEAFFEAKRQASRVSKHIREQASKKPAWSGPDEFEIATGEEDFEQFLESVRARSMSTRAKIIPSLPAEVHRVEMNGHVTGGDQIKVEELDNSDIEMFSRTKKTRAGVVKPAKQPVISLKEDPSSDLEWDTGDFVTAFPPTVPTTHAVHAPGSTATTSPVSSEAER